jgi:hypothetical protein
MAIREYAVNLDVRKAQPLLQPIHGDSGETVKQSGESWALAR